MQNSRCRVEKQACLPKTGGLTNTWGYCRHGRSLEKIKFIRIYYGFRNIMLRCNINGFRNIMLRGKTVTNIDSSGEHTSLDGQIK